MGKIVTGETELTIGTIADGQYLKRNGTEIVSAAAGGSGSGITIDAFSNRPAAGTAGAEFIATDTYMPVRCIDNGSAWKNYYNGFLCTDPPAASSLSQIHFSLSAGSASLTDVGDGLLFTQTGNNSTSARDTSYAVAPIPESGAYSFVVGMVINMGPRYWTWLGLALTDGNGAAPKSIFFGPFVRDSGRIHYDFVYDSSPTSYGGTDIVICEGFLSLLTIFMKVEDDRTNLHWYISYDAVSWVWVYSVSRGAYLTPSHIGIMLGQQGGGGLAIPTTRTRSMMRVFHWSLG